MSHRIARPSAPRPALLLTVLLLILGLASCGGDSGDPAVDEPDEFLIAATVDADGDTLVHDDISVGIPAGALAESASITVARVEPSWMPGTGTFEITGLPVPLQEPLTVSLRRTTGDEIADPQPLVMADALLVSAEQDTVRLAFDLEATLDGETMTAEIDHASFVPDKDVAGAWIMTVILAGSTALEQSSVSSPLRITIVGPGVLADERAQFTEWHRDAVNAFRTATADFWQIATPGGPSRFTHIEGRVTWGHSDHAIAHGQWSDPPSPRSAFIRSTLRVDPEGPGDEVAVRSWFGRSLWYAFYEGRTGQQVDFWKYASGEALLRGTWPDHILFWGPGGRVISPLVGLGGMMQDDDFDPAVFVNYGGSLIPFADWILNRTGDGWGEDGLAATLAHRADPELGLGVEFLGAALPGPARTWWSDFADDLMQGNVATMSPIFMLDQADDEWVVADGDDTSHEFSRTHRFLDGAVYRITLARDDFAPGATLRLDMLGADSDCRLLLYKLTDEDQLTFLSDESAIDVEGLADMVDEEADLVAVVTNAELSLSAPEREITVRATISEPDPGAEVFSMTRARCQLSWFDYRTTSSNPDCTDGRDVDDDYFLVGWFAEGAWEGTTFVGSLSGEADAAGIGHHHYDVQIRVGVSSDGQRVTSVDYTYTLQDYNGAMPDHFETHRITFQGTLPNISPFAYDVDFGAEGTSNLSGVVYTVDHWTEDEPECVYRTTSFTLRPDCEMYVSFQE